MKRRRRTRRHEPLTRSTRICFGRSKMQASAAGHGNGCTSECQPQRRGRGRLTHLRQPYTRPKVTRLTQRYGVWVRHAELGVPRANVRNTAHSATESFATRDCATTFSGAQTHNRRLGVPCSPWLETACARAQMAVESREVWSTLAKECRLICVRAAGGWQSIDVLSESVCRSIALLSAHSRRALTRR